jgi:hypothetical protein
VVERIRDSEQSRAVDAELAHELATQAFWYLRIADLGIAMSKTSHLPGRLINSYSEAQGDQGARLHDRREGRVS